MFDDKLVFTVAGLKAVTERLTDRTFRVYGTRFHNRKIPELKTEEEKRLLLQSRRPVIFFLWANENRITKIPCMILVSL
jgi:hypothetical protein